MDVDHPDYTAASDIIVDLVRSLVSFKKSSPAIPHAFSSLLKIKICGIHRRPRTLYIGGDSTLAYNYDSNGLA